MKKTSSRRIISQFKNVELSTIALVQSAYVNKDANLIKKILNKPNIKDYSALQLGNLANQYISNIANPSTKFIKNVKSDFKIPLSNDYQSNLKILKNIIEYDMEEILRTTKGVVVRTKQGYRKTIINPYNEQQFLVDIALIDVYSNQITIDTNVTELRVHFYLLTKNNDEIIVSTKYLPLNSFYQILAFMQKYTRMIIDESFEYYYENTETFEKIKQILKVEIVYR